MAETKEKGLDRAVRHLGTFKNFRGAEMPGYLVWHDDGESERGFKLMCSATNREFKPGLLVLRVDQLAAAKVSFTLSGETEPLEAKAVKLKKGDSVLLPDGGTGVIVKIDAKKKSADVKLDVNGNVSPFDLADLKPAPAQSEA